MKDKNALAKKKRRRSLASIVTPPSLNRVKQIFSSQSLKDTFASLHSSDETTDPKTYCAFSFPYLILFFFLYLHSPTFSIIY
jgi:hypothetical protein